jgi:Cft2 family RNA processing exonuclease
MAAETLTQKGLDVLIVESTYGVHVHASRAERGQKDEMGWLTSALTLQFKQLL